MSNYDLAYSASLSPPDSCKQKLNNVGLRFTEAFHSICNPHSTRIRLQKGTLEMYCLRNLMRLERASARAASSLFPLLEENSRILDPIKRHRTGYNSVTGRSLSKLTSVKASVQTQHKENVSTAITISNTASDHENRMFEVKWQDGTSDKYPYIWLRDCCQCPSCYHTSSQNRMLLIGDLQLSVTPDSVHLSESGGVMEIVWSDGHKAYYPSEWLHARAFDENRRAKRLEFIRPKITHWEAKAIQNLPRESFTEAMERDDVLLRVLQQLEEFGIAILHNAPARKGQFQLLAERIGYSRRTPDGELFLVTSKVDAHNLAYTANTLDLHVDYAHLEYKPGVQVLHCIAQTKGDGGETLFVDSFKVANELRVSHPEKFEILANTPVDYKDEGRMISGLVVGSIYQVPMICLDRTGSIKAVVSSNLMRDTFFCVPLEKVERWYEAMITFNNLLIQPKNVFEYKLQEGDMVMFDNDRILHGRTSFEVTASPRELEGGYFDWDIVKSRRRVLQKKL